MRARLATCSEKVREPAKEIHWSPTRAEKVTFGQVSEKGRNQFENWDLRLNQERTGLHQSPIKRKLIENVVYLLCKPIHSFV